MMVHSGMASHLMTRSPMAGFPTHFVDSRKQILSEERKGREYDLIALSYTKQAFTQVQPVKSYTIRPHALQTQI